MAVNIYLFNQGRETIRDNNVYFPIELGFSDSKIDILGFRMLKTTREMCGINVVLDTAKNKLRVNFKALEQDDGFAGQIIYDGPINPYVTVLGGIDGAKHFTFSRGANIFGYPLKTIYLYVQLFFPGVSLLCLVLDSLFKTVVWLKPILRRVALVSIVCFFVISISMAIYFFSMKVKEIVISQNP